MNSFNTGITALRAAQVGLAVTSNNIANADTDGYHRQRVDLVDRRGIYEANLWLGAGVDVSRIARLRNATVEQALTATLSGRASSEMQLQAFQQIETAFTPGAGSLHSLVTDFFDKVEQMTLNPAESVLRREVVSTASLLAQAIGEISNAFTKVSSAAGGEALDAVKTVNRLATEIAEVNRNIRVAQSRAENPNTLYDQRDRLINQLAEYVDIDHRSLIDGGDPLVAAGGSLIIGHATTQISVQTSADGRLTLASSTGQTGIEVTGGKLGGLLESMHAVDLGIQSDFRDWAKTLIREIDNIQATGISLQGPLNSIVGQRGVSDVTVPLQQTDAFLEMQSGDLSLTVTDATGQLQTHVIPIDVTVDSLNDVAARIDAIANVSAMVNSVTGTLSLSADSGYGIDFSARTAPAPVSSAITGTAAPAISGRFTGATNSTWTAEVITGGQIGVSTDLLVRITDSATGQVVGEMRPGLGYAAGEAVEIADGISLAFGPGTLNAGDTFDMRLISDADETGLLASLGMQTLFVGDDLSSLAVHPDVLDNPAAFAASHAGGPGEGLQLDRFIQLRSATLFSSGLETFEERLSSIVGSSGILVASQQLEIDQRELRLSDLETARDAISGVDPNEELLQMLQFQRAFQAASKFITSMDESLDELMRLVG